ncbi:MAG: hypothetical protein KC476_08480 [Cyanobacteria bacterium HKST-UBA06]|nr:hypothetical protein [Cyanobacteria bacterium HKST-UBA06]
MKVDAISNDTAYYFLRQLGLERFNVKNLSAGHCATARSWESKKAKGAWSMSRYAEPDENGEVEGVDGQNNNVAYLSRSNGNSPAELLKKIGLSANKFTFLRMMRGSTLRALVPYLNKEQLLLAMRLFPKMLLVRLIGSLPKDMLLKMILHTIPLKKFLALFKAKVLFSIVANKRLNVREMVNGLEHLPREELQRLMTNITGSDTTQLSKPELLGMFRELDKLQLMNGLRKMGQEHFLEFVYQVTKKDPQLLMALPRGELMKVVNSMPKPTLVELFNLLPKSQLEQFVSMLPYKALLVALYQIDNKVMESLLVNQFPDLIAALAGDGLEAA